MCAADGISLIGIDLSQVSLNEGSFKNFLTALPHTLVSLSFSRAGLRGVDGDLTALCLQHSLRFLDVSSNRFSGALPECLADLRALEFVSFAGNDLSGSIPPLWARFGGRLAGLHLHGNIGLKGTIGGPLAKALANIKSLTLPHALHAELNVAVLGITN